MTYAISLRSAILFLLPLFLVSIACERPADPDAIVRDTTAVDTLDMTEEGDDLVSTMENDGRFSTLVAAVDSAGLRDTFAGPGPFTIFAPTDDAFDALEEGSVEDLLSPANREELRDVLMNHVANGRRMASDLRGAPSVETMYGDQVSIRSDNEALHVGSAQVIESDITANNGVIHAIDSVLQPATIETEEPNL